MSNENASEPSPDLYATERAYLEQLLATRVNLYLLFVSFYFVAVFGAEADVVSDEMRAMAFFLGALISALMTLSVWRTTLLVEHVLRRFRHLNEKHPYTLAYLHLDKKPFPLWVSANWILFCMPLVVTAALVCFALDALY